MGQHEIEQSAAAKHKCPNVQKGLKLLLALVHAVNSQSDGWAYWAAPSNSCLRLITLLKSTGRLTMGSQLAITDADLKKAVAPIRSMVTHQRKQQAKYGNTFDFDVDAALA